MQRHEKIKQLITKKNRLKSKITAPSCKAKQKLVHWGPKIKNKNKATGAVSWQQNCDRHSNVRKIQLPRRKSINILLFSTEIAL